MSALREVRRVAVIDVQVIVVDAVQKITEYPEGRWPEACEEAYDAIRKNTPADLHHGITMIEPYGRVDGFFEWRTYWHSPDGFETVYAAVREVEPDGAGTDS